MKTWMKWMALCSCLLLFVSCERRGKLKAEMVDPSTVRILNVALDSGGRIENASWGTGFIINGNGNIVTNHHVTAGSSRLFVFHRVEGKTRLYSGHLVEKSRERDLSVIRTGIKGRPLKINRKDPAKNDDVYSCGYPGIADNEAAVVPLIQLILEKGNDPGLETGLDLTKDMDGNKIMAQLFEPTLSPGKITRFSNQPLLLISNDGNVETERYRNNGTGEIFEVQKRGERAINLLEHSVTIGHGNSGGPLVDEGGYVIGVVGQGMSRKDGDSVTWAISAPKELVPFLQNEAGVKDFMMDEFDVANMGKMSRLLIILLSLAGAAVLVAIGAGIFLLARRNPATGSPSMTMIQRKIDEVIGAKGAKTKLVEPVNPGNNGPPRPSDVMWEVDVTGPSGMRMTPRFKESDFAKAGGRIVVGRNSDFSSVTVAHESVSRQHLHFTMRDGGLAVADRNSSNGTKVNGVALTSPFREHNLREGDRIQFGEMVATVRRAF